MRQGFQEIGLRIGMSPQETAVSIVAQLPIFLSMDIKKAIIIEWLTNFKVNPEKTDVQIALDKLDMWSNAKEIYKKLTGHTLEFSSAYWSAKSMEFSVDDIDEYAKQLVDGINNSYSHLK